MNENQKDKKLNLTPHLNRSRVRRTALELASKRAQKFTRVGQRFIQRIEVITRNAIALEVQRHPSKGKTLL